MRSKLARVLATPAICRGGCLEGRADQGLAFMVGQNIQFAVERMGYPDAKRETAGGTVLFLERRPRRESADDGQRHHGRAGGVPAYGSTTGLDYKRGAFNCAVQMSVGADQITKSWRWSGNIAGCMGYAASPRR